MTSAKDGSSRAFTIIAATDFKDGGGFAFDAAARLAATVKGSELHLIHVFQGEPSPEQRRQLVANLRQYVNDKAAMLGGFAGNKVGIHLRSGEPVDEITQLAEEIRADLVVVGSGGKGPHLKSWLVGTTAERLVASAGFPVLLAGPRAASVESRVPKIDPACADCLAARAKSNGTTWWCERHSHPAARAHTYSYTREIPFSSGDEVVIPAGIDNPS